MLVTTQRVLQAHIDNESFNLVTYGPLGSGKSVHAIKVLAEVYGEKQVITDPNGNKALVVAEMNWDAWKSYLVFLPKEFVYRLSEAQARPDPTKLIVWDDAGIWASNQKWSDEFSKAVSDLVNVQRTVFNSVIYTTPDPTWLLKRIRKLPDGHTGRVNKTTGNKYQQHLRELRAYQGWVAPDFTKTGVKAVYVDSYSKILPDKVYQEYKEKRRGYSALAIKHLQEIVDRMAAEGNEEKANDFKQEVKMKAGLDLDKKGYDKEVAPLPV